MKSPNAVPQVGKIAERARKYAKHSWEYGAVSHALLEIYDPTLSPFFGDFCSLEELDDDKIQQATGLKYAKEFICTGQATLLDGEGSAGDPASLGFAAILLGKVDTTYYDAALRQRAVLLNSTPRYENGAISHRESVAELWSDFTYMALPFLALSAFYARDEKLFQEIVRQCDLQKQVLQDNATGLWKHIVGPDSPDPGLWSSGNGWAACGLVRVFALVLKFDSLEAGKLPRQLESVLETTIVSIIGAAASSKSHEDGLLPNYLDDASYFGENAGTAAIASAVFRMASLKPSAISAKYIAWAVKSLEAVLSHTSEDGTVSPVANPMDAHDRAPFPHSAEGQAFTLHLIAAHRDWTKSESTRTSILDTKPERRTCF